VALSTHANAIITEVLLAVVAAMETISGSANATVRALLIIPIFQSHVCRTAVVGVQHPVHELEGITDPALGQSGGDWGGGIPGTEMFIRDVGMCAGAIAGSGIGVLGVDDERGSASVL
jgi:hypothetical protein